MLCCTSQCSIKKTSASRNAGASTAGTAHCLRLARSAAHQGATPLKLGLQDNACEQVPYDDNGLARALRVNTFPFKKQFEGALVQTHHVVMITRRWSCEALLVRHRFELLHPAPFLSLSRSLSLATEGPVFFALRYFLSSWSPFGRNAG